MRRPGLFLCCTSALLLHPVASHAQDVLSFEPGGREACSKAIHMPIPGNDTSGSEQKSFGFGCAERDLAIEKVRFAAVRKSVEGRSPEERIAYNVLIVSLSEFLDSHIANEACRGGTNCGMINENEKALVNYDFLAMAEGFIKDGFPSFTTDDLAREDAALNVAYQKVLSSLPEGCQSSDRTSECVSQTDLRDTERAWIRYRDAWVTFGTLRWPQVTSTSILTYLTRQRTKQLTGSAPEPLLHKSLSPAFASSRTPQTLFFLYTKDSSLLQESTYVYSSDYAEVVRQIRADRSP
jgi:uncharacterized protein YecT (DUF1311 family)